MDKAIADYLTKYHESQLPSKKDIDGWIDDKGEDYVIALFAYITFGIGKDLDSPVGYFKAVANSDWQPPSPSYSKGKKKKKERYVPRFFKAAKEVLAELKDNYFVVLNHKDEEEFVLRQEDLEWLWQNPYSTLTSPEDEAKFFWIHYGALNCTGLATDLLYFVRANRDIYGEDKYRYYLKIKAAADQEEEREKEDKTKADRNSQLELGTETLANTAFRQRLRDNIESLDITYPTEEEE